MKTTVNERVKWLRTQLNVTQQRFAEAIGMTAPQLSRIENGESDPQQGTLEKIASATSVTIDWLKSGKGDVKPVLKESVSVFDPARDTLYKEMKDQIAFYRQLLMQLTGGKGASFLQALNGTGLQKRLLRASA